MTTEPSSAVGAGAAGTGGGLAPGAWLDAFSAARCLGDTDTLDLLCRIQVAATDAAGGGATSTLVAALRTDHGRATGVAVTLSDPVPTSREAATVTGSGSGAVTAAQADALLQALMGDQDSFDRALGVALAEHEVWSTGPTAPASAFLATRLLAAACIAVDRGLAVGPPPDHLPRWILDLDRSDYLARTGPVVPGRGSATASAPSTTLSR